MFRHLSSDAPNRIEWRGDHRLRTGNRQAKRENQYMRISFATFRIRAVSSRRPSSQRAICRVLFNVSTAP